jgi:anaerobic selenocysteine-containing dehydrogenase
MMSVPYGDRPAMVNAIVAAIKGGGLVAVDVDIVPTKIGEACHVWLPAATSGEANLTSMNGERRVRLTEKYMDPPGQAMPDSLIAAQIANHMERILREQGKGEYADKFTASTGRLTKMPSWTGITAMKRAASLSLANVCRRWEPTVFRNPRRRSRMASFMLFAYPTGVQGNVVSPGVSEFIIPNYKQTWGSIRKITDAPEGVRHLSFKSLDYTT